MLIPILFPWAKFGSLRSEGSSGAMQWEGLIEEGVPTRCADLGMVHGA